jgi:nucleoside-diphosphate-sugar epimerase
MNKAFIVGAGQVGTFVSRNLVSSGFSVCVCDSDPSPGYFYRYSEAADGVLNSVHASDLQTIEKLAQGHGSDVAIICIGGHQKTSTEFIESDGDQIHALVHCLSAIGTSCFVLISSRAVYGRNGENEINEASPTKPSSEYGHYMLDREIRFQSALNDINRTGVIVRSSGLFGPVRFGQGSHSAKLFDQLLHAAITGANVTITGGENTKDDYLYIEDLARAIGALMKLPRELWPPVINIGPGRLFGMNEICKAFADVFNGWEPNITLDSDCQIPLSALSIKLATSKLGFKPLSLYSSLLSYSQLSNVEAKFGNSK